MFNVFKIFYAVGQGGFYSERICYKGASKVIVYDCGAIKRTPRDPATQDLIISINTSGLEKVDYIVISHLDNDHTNGLKNLIDYLKRVSSITGEPYKDPVMILPNPTLEDLFLFFKDSSEDDIGEFFDVLSSTKLIVLISKDGNSDFVNLDVDRNRISVVSHNSIFYMFDRNDGWQIKFYVDEAKYVKMVGDDATIKQIEGVTINDFLIENKKERNEKIKEIKKLFENVDVGKSDKSRMNNSSMAMISAPCNPDMRVRNCEQEMNSPYISWLNGDICLKEEDELSRIENHYQDFLSLNIDFQVPHHGSKENLSRLPKVLGKMRTYIWAGFDNAHGHPNGTILNMLKDAGLEINWITEKDQHIILHEEWI